MIAVRNFALGLLLGAAPVTVSAQAVTDIKIGQTLTKKVGIKIDIYRFVGGSGTTIKATLTAPGKAALILYTPAGEEMLTAQGNGSVTLEAILPLWDVFFLSVVREGGAMPYALGLTGDEPDAHLALFAHNVGFARSLYKTCWVEPGISKRRKWSTGTDVATLGRQGRYVTEFFGSDGRSLGNARTTKVDIKGDDVTATNADASKIVFTLSGLLGENPGRYIGMGCDKQ